MQTCEFRVLPSHMARVFHAFKKRPVIFSKDDVDGFNDRFKLMLSPSSTISVSSAYCEILCSVSPMEIPIIFLCCRVINASNLTHTTNKYGDIGSPCLQPLWIENHCPLTATVDFISLQNVNIHWHLYIWSKTKGTNNFKREFPMDWIKGFLKVQAQR